MSRISSANTGLAIDSLAPRATRREGGAGFRQHQHGDGARHFPDQDDDVVVVDLAEEHRFTPASGAASYRTSESTGGDGDSPVLEDVALGQIIDVIV
ncbi:hypothetical protein Pan216_18720 [Planctomycetes bacterium Pan216]|uniref:Uncharacterized protein n=1 Tax=Kolteria novifilia TaxID=2527975 RepID=A0A518B213_9BACT|nr:hypothetical protein Pan216_18720 [Planctomycetes bacterium Pan216]